MFHQVPTPNSLKIIFILFHIERYFDVMEFVKPTKHFIFRIKIPSIFIDGNQMAFLKSISISGDHLCWTLSLQTFDIRSSTC